MWVHKLQAYIMPYLQALYRCLLSSVCSTHIPYHIISAKRFKALLFFAVILTLRNKQV